MLVKIPETQLVRDTNSMALMNQDHAARDEYMNKVKLLRTQKEEINKVNSEILSIKEEMSEIKYLLTKIMEKI